MTPPRWKYRRTPTMEMEIDMKTYSLATEVNGMVMHLDLPLFTRQTAENHAKTLREMSPASPIFVINKASE